MQQLSYAELSGLLEPDGTLADLINDYEMRQCQSDMLELVVQALNDNKHMIAEAGTGTGKSLAYLLAALQWAHINESRVIISTATIALQKQLMDNDIPLTQKLLGLDLDIALVKGRGNYLCLKRLHETSFENDFFDSASQINAILQWSDKTKTGDMSDIPFHYEPTLWNRVRCEDDNCPGRYCSFYEQCFFMRSRRSAAHASVMISNHHLLLADLAARMNRDNQEDTAVLPSYDCIILDEAHHLEPYATDMFSSHLTSGRLNRYYNRLYRKKGKTFEGLVRRLMDLSLQPAQMLGSKTPILIDNARDAAEKLDSLAQQLLLDTNTLRLAGTLDDRQKELLLDPMENLKVHLGNLIDIISDAFDAFQNIQDMDDALQAMLIELGQILDGLQGACDLLNSFVCYQDLGDYVFWLESSPMNAGMSILYHCTPLSVAHIMKNALWETGRTVICVSATLTIKGQFDHWLSQVGISQIGGNDSSDDPLLGLFPSHFDYKYRVMLGIPRDAPVPLPHQSRLNYLSQTIADAIRIADGRTLVLFTSYEELKGTMVSVQQILGPQSPPILAQGTADRNLILNRFKKEIKSVLFGTDSFWEGVDVPGPSLSLVIITRLPFRPPHHPVDEAKGDLLSSMGGNPFMELTLPAAITRFRQGFGRLMRRGTDGGSVVVLDPRIINKKYGKSFLNSLPPTEECFQTTAEVLEYLREFFNQLEVN